MRPQAHRDGFPVEIKQSMLVPESYVPPPSTEEPPLANAVDLNRVKSPIAAKPEGYLAYGQAGTARPAASLVMDRR